MADAHIPTNDAGLEAVPALNESLILVRRAQAGDRDALNRLFERYYDRILRIVRIRMGTKLLSMLEHQDIVQETCAVAVRKIHDFEPRDHASLIQWLSKIAEHQIRDARDRMTAAKRDRSREVALDAASTNSSGEPMALQVQVEGPGPSSLAAGAELREIYDSCVEELAEDQRELVLLREYVGASWEQIVEKTGRPNVHAAQEAYRRAQLRMARSLHARTKGLDPRRG